MNNTDNHLTLSSTNEYDPRYSQTTSRNRSISSSINDNESSNSTAPSTPTSIHRGRDELQHVPSMNGNGPRDPKDIVRKEKKRERNRQAAQKCRTRKLTRIAELQKRVNELQGKNRNLTSVAENLQNDIVRLEKQLQDHHSQGCTLMNGSGL
jgi:chromosome segregation ATPase